MSEYFVYLEKRLPEKGQMRFYALRLMPSLFGDWTVVREWGRIGSPGRVTVDWFDTVEDAQAALQRKADEKRRKGYRDIAGPPGSDSVIR